MQMICVNRIFFYYSQKYESLSNFSDFPPDVLAVEKKWFWHKKMNYKECSE